MKDNLLKYKDYTAKPEFSADDRLFYGKILGIGDLVDFSASSVDDLESAFHSAVDDYLVFCEEIGKQPQKEYSGVFNVRISSDLHRKISSLAQAEGVSLNKAVEQAIAAYV